MTPDRRWLEHFPIGDPHGRRILFDPISAVLGGAGIVTNVIGGIKGKSTAERAAAAQKAQAESSAKRIEAATAETNPAILEAATNAGGALNARADAAASGVASAADRANNLLDPYRAAGNESNEELRRNLVAGGDFNKTPTAADIQIDPGYAFRQQQAELALSRGAAARGTVSSGGFAVDLNRQIQGQASQEYQAAFQRFRDTQADRFNRLNTVAGRGRDVASEEGGNLTEAARYGGDITTGATRTAGGWDIDATNTTSHNTIEAARQAEELRTQGANAEAAGKVAGSNALWGGITAGVNAGTGAVQFDRALKALKNPTIGIATTPTERGALQYNPNATLPMPSHLSAGDAPNLLAYPRQNKVAA